VAFNQDVAERLREVFGAHPGLTEKKMFGGLSFLVNGNMCCGVIGDELVVRVDPNSVGEALARPGARPMDFTGRPMKGWVMVAPAGFATTEELTSWVELALKYVEGLPPK